MQIQFIPTDRLVEEISVREGVEEKRLAPGEEIVISGPAVVLVVIE